MKSLSSKTFHIPFMSHWKNAFRLSGVVVLSFWCLIAFKGIKYGIDFSGGTNVLLKLHKATTIDSVRTISKNINSSAEVQTFGDDGEGLFLISLLGAQKAKEVDQGTSISKLLIDGFKKSLGAENVTSMQVETVGAKIGSEFKTDGLLSLFMALGVIFVYIAFRFNVNFSPGAIICLIHDISLTAGIFVLLGKEFNLSTVAALLTIVGYSLNDTIVVYDRIREVFQKYGKRKKTEEILNIGINQTLSRTILTSTTTLFTTSCLFVFGSGLIKDFALALSIGVLVGTYSSIYIASPFILIYERLTEKKANA